MPENGNEKRGLKGVSVTSQLDLFFPEISFLKDVLEYSKFDKRRCQVLIAKG